MVTFGTNRLAVETLLAGEVKLASPPEVFLRLCEILDDPAKTVYDAERVIEHDPGTAARLLRLVNSAFYGFPRQITSISRAIAMIGLKELRDLILATWVVERFSRLPNRLLDMRAFWRVSVRTGLLARALARRHAQAKSLQSVFVCGLLHEIGRLVIYAKIPELGRAAELLTKAEGIEEIEAERRIYGFDHYQLAAELARRWRLPEVFVATLRWHGSPGEAGSFARETALVTLASRLSLAEVFPAEAVGPTALLAFLHLPAACLPEALEEAEAQLDEVFRGLFRG
nr:metal dependent phosphohydrolase [uncultured Gammaproteobacteria bacterium]BAL57274.1 metal dependent phosphohydrolase [uncultured Gammaproteobacteria bacterium]